MRHPSHCRNDFFPIQRRGHNNHLLDDPSSPSFLNTQTRPVDDLFQSLRHWHLDDISWHGKLNDLLANRVRQTFAHVASHHHTYDFFPYQEHWHIDTCAKLLCNLWDGDFYDPSTNPLRTITTLQYQTHHPQSSLSKTEGTYTADNMFGETCDKLLGGNLRCAEPDSPPQRFRSKSEALAQQQNLRRTAPPTCGTETSTI